MDEGRIVAWHKRVGDAVAAGEVLFEVETDKATMEVESPAAGTLRRILYSADSSAPVATVIALISDTADEPLPSELLGAELPKPSLRADPQPSPAGGLHDPLTSAGASSADASVAACAKTLLDHPRLRGRIEDDALVISDAIHVGIAIALDDGLLVPVLRDADRKNLSELARERERLEQHA